MWRCVRVHGGARWGLRGLVLIKRHQNLATLLCGTSSLLRILKRRPKMLSPLVGVPLAVGALGPAHSVMRAGSVI